MTYFPPWERGFFEFSFFARQLVRSDQVVRFSFITPRPLTDSKQMDFVRNARNLIQKGQFDEAVSVDWLLS